jgi:hypothetical protein
MDGKPAWGYLRLRAASRIRNPLDRGHFEDRGGLPGRRKDEQ